MAKTYEELLKDPRWQKRRLKTFERDGWKCTQCGNSTQELHAHHTLYITGRDPWDYPEDAIKTLCDDCHGKAHNVKKPFKPNYDIVALGRSIGETLRALAAMDHKERTKIKEEGNG